MEVTASTKYIRMSPRKLRLVAKEIVGLSVNDAVTRLEFLSKAAVTPLIATLKSAAANAVNNNQLEQAKLKIKNVLVNEGPRLKRQDRSHSMRAERGLITKGMSHLKIILTA